MLYHKYIFTFSCYFTLIFKFLAIVKVRPTSDFLPSVLFTLLPHTYTHTPPPLNFFLPCPPSHSSSVEVSGLHRRSAIWAGADKSSCAGPAVPAGLPEASQA